MDTKLKIATLLSLAVLGSASVAGLYYMSERQLRFHNNFTRRYPPHMADQLNSLELEFNSYYFAGHGDGKIFLGNTTAPFQVTVLDTALRIISKHKVTLDRPLSRMRQPMLSVDFPDFYFFEGASPYIYSGSACDWKAILRTDSGPYFSRLVPAGPGKVAVRYNDSVTAENSIGMVDVYDKTKNKMTKGLLEKIADGTFDTDGILVGDSKKNRFHYIYYYRNSFTTADSELRNVVRSQTIDTVSGRDIEVANVQSIGARKLARNPLMANRLAAADGGWLFINSLIMGQFDREPVWKNSSIIDIYDLRTRAYLASITLDNDGRRKVRSMMVSGDNLYAMGETKIIRYRLRRFMVRE